MAAISTRCDGSAKEGWTCLVTLRQGGVDISKHYVRVWSGDMGRAARGATGPDELVKASFAFLLERESPYSILRSFDLGDIVRFFPEYDTKFPVRRR